MLRENRLIKNGFGKTFLGKMTWDLGGGEMRLNLIMSASFLKNERGGGYS